MIEIILILILIAVLLKRRQSKKFALKSLAASFALSLLFILIFEFINGLHPECGLNDSVGPCDYSGRVLFDLPFSIFITLFFWFVIVLVDTLIIYVRKRRAERKS